MTKQPSKNIIDQCNTFESKKIELISVGNFVKMQYKIQDGKKEKILKYEGLITAINNKNASKTFTLNSLSNNVEIIRIFPYNSPHILEIQLKERIKTRHSKLYNFKLKKKKN